MPVRRRALLLAASAGAGAVRAQPTPVEPDCLLCRARLPTVQALRDRLPAGWQVALEPESVLGGDMLVVRAGPPTAAPLLLVHGLGQHGFSDWVPVMPALARQRRVLAVDLPGFGYSSLPSAKLSPTNLARALASWLERERIADCTVVGHSMGGAVAMRLAELLPQRVSALVLVDVAGVLHRTAFSKHILSVPLAVEGMPEPLKEPVARLRDLGRVLVERMFGIGTDPTEVLRQNEWLWPLAMRDRTTIHAALALVDEDFGALLPQLRQPVHVIWGEADPIAPLRTGELLARRLPRAQLWTLPGVGHLPMEQATAEFQAVLDRALSQPPVQRVPPVPSTEAAGDLTLDGVVGRRLSGRYRELQLRRCTAMRLVDLDADRIVLLSSSVQMTGVRVRADDVAVDLSDSELEATACDFEGRTAIRADASRVDLAGTRLLARGFAVQVQRRSRLVASVCEVRDAYGERRWHDDRTLEQALLEPPQPAAPRRSS